MGGQELTRHTLSTFIPWFVQLLQTFDAPNNLEYIVLNITFYLNASRPFMKPDWQHLARTLTSESFSSLRRVEMHVRCSVYMPLDFPTLMPFLQDDVHLSSLVQSGLLSIIEHPDC